MSQAPKSGREIEDHHVHNASEFVTRLLGTVSDDSDNDNES